jgi:hypothetical protein
MTSQGFQLQFLWDDGPRSGPAPWSMVQLRSANRRTVGHAPDTVEAAEAQETTLQLLRWQFLILRLWNHVDSVDSVEGPWRVCPKFVRNIDVWRQHVLRALKSSQTGNGGRDLACGDCISASSTCLQC